MRLLGTVGMCFTVMLVIFGTTAIVFLHEFPPRTRTIGDVCTLTKENTGVVFSPTYYWTDGSGKIPDGICADMYSADDNGWGVDLPRPNQPTLTVGFPSYDAAVKWVESQPYKRRHTR